MLNPEDVPARPSGGRLQGKIAFVLGAGSVGAGWSNGNAAAALFAREGAKVFAVDRNQAAAEAVAGLIQAMGGTCDIAVADATQQAELAEAVAACVQRHGRIDILHSNIGGSLARPDATRGGVLETHALDWRAVLELNLTAPFLATQCVLPAMLEAGGGVITYVSSNAAIAYPELRMVAYSAAKAGLHQLSRSVAVQYAAQGIRANCLVLGHIETDEIKRRMQARGGANAVAEMVARRNAIVPIGRVGTVWEVAEAAVWLASDAGAYITGAELVLDGGSSVPIVRNYMAGG